MGHTEETFLSNAYQAVITSATTAVSNKEIVNFEVTLQSANEPKVLHLVVADEFVKPDYGSEASVMASMKVGQQADEDGNITGTISEEPVEVLYRYIMDVTGNKTPKNDIPTVVGLYKDPDYATSKDYTVVDGNVVERASGPELVTLNNVEWMKILLYPKAPTAVSTEQKFTIVDENGLGRIITLSLQLPWEFAPIGGTANPVLDNGQKIYATIAEGKNNDYQGLPEVISPKAGEEITVYFNLPDGMPESVFPLEFTLESLKQGIENNKVGTLAVTYGNSLFSENKGQIAIQYLKTLTYNEYMYEYTDDDSNDVNINKLNKNHTVRCRFLTISATAENSEGRIMIYNKYFKENVSVAFVRKTTD